MLLYVHCVAYLCAGVILGWNPELSPKFQHILATQETLTDLQGDEKNPKWPTQNIQGLVLG